MHSRRATRKACALCHERKIKCDGATPSCRNCLRAQALCRPHERRRRFTVRTPEINPGQPPLATFERLTWLENELLRVLNIDLREVSTGTALDSLLRAQGTPRVARHPAQNAGARFAMSQSEGHPPTEVDPDIPLLAFNATGEARYLGASSGSIFAQFIANTAQSILTPGPTGPCLHPHTDESSTVHRAVVSFNAANWRTSGIFAFLLRCYLKWVHSCYPLFMSQDIAALESMGNSSNAPPETGDMAIIFYLVMSIGAVHSEQRHLLDHFQADTGLREYQNDASTYGITSEALYRKALALLASEPSNLVPRTSLVQILDLISIYASHRPSDNEQWHIAGMAMRIAIELGLHRHNDGWKFTTDELEHRRRVFWTTYAIEITLAFNLGRPTSISFEDADAPLPSNTEEVALSIHHIRHRQIQEQMLCVVYRSRSRNAVPVAEPEESLSKVESLQQKLDRWHQELHELYYQSASPYPVEYWDRLYYSTSAALSRPTPLVPRPGPKLQKRCFLSSCRVIEIHEKLIRNFRLPYSWMLLQGLVFSAISMIVTARTSPIVLSREFGVDEFLDVLTRCVRKFHVVLAVLRERWTGLGMRHLENLLDKLCQDTLRHTINILAKQPSGKALSVQPSFHPDFPSENLPASSPEAREDELAATSGISNGRRNDRPPLNEDGLPGGLLGEAAYLDANNQVQSAIYPWTPGHDLREDWRIFDNLFEPDELRFLFDFLPNESYTI
ncbi:fungal-specific transcription factor domain-containing protein [Aspergillus pseudocaelatus]|uniref:Fungal-specific transcription factor domain-containing protein n=1 Tax=Aspergillus pseudocaelatus TaxID=1825620 RepID=A0ABQ6WUT4_9EURO|nr:fungal-specific transcription factor domain-containing protein [Aspergillus pseudocaelatus]